MNAINLYALTRVDELDTFIKFEKQLSKRDKLLRLRQHEMDSVVSFVDFLFSHSVQPEIYNDYYFSYKIPQISKEFDLLRINDKQVINIELKSKHVSREKILRQLIRNKYYLSHLKKEIYLYTYIANTNEIYQLTNDDQLKTISINDLIQLLKQQNDCCSDDINRYFGVSNFLVSPLNSPSIFLQSAYFLTHQQEQYKKEILYCLYGQSKIQFIGLTGSAGTGKTLLIYDIALECAEKTKCLMIHCGQLCEGHSELDKKLPMLDIISVRMLKYGFDFSPYKYIFVDESHRIYGNQFMMINQYATNEDIQVIYSYDSKQFLSESELRNEIPSKIENLENCNIYELSDKIRTNKELASFIRQIMRKDPAKKLECYPSVTINYANDEQECIRLLRKYYGDYTFINFTKSTIKDGEFDIYGNDHLNTHKVIGQEFDNVLMLMGSNFFYDTDGRLIGRKHPNPNYIYTQLLYQGLTRVREKLAIIVIGNKQLFKDILSILQ